VSDTSITEEALSEPFAERPVLNGARVVPSDLLWHRVTHRLLAPCCFCPLLDPSEPDVVETAIFRVAAGQHSGEYVAACAQNRCDYVGKPLTVIR
jgi:hypothetical protein